MKNIIVIFTFSLLGFVCKAQQKSVPAEYDLKAKIINKVNLGAGCGYFKLASVIEFEIIDFSNQSYKSKNIAVVFRYAEFYGNNFFEPGKIYEIKIEEKDENPAKNDFDFTIQNQEVLENYNSSSSFWDSNHSAKKL